MTGTPAPAVRASDGGGLGGARGEDVAGDGDGDTRRRRRAAPRRRRVTPSFDLLRAAPFGSSRALWHDAVLRPLRERRSEGIATLRRTLSRLLVRAVRRELLLPPTTPRAAACLPSRTRACSTNSPISCGSICSSRIGTTRNTRNRSCTAIARSTPGSCTSTCERRVASRARFASRRRNTTCARHSRSSRADAGFPPRRVGLYPQNGRGHRPRRARRRRGRRRFARERRVPSRTPRTKQTVRRIPTPAPVRIPRRRFANAAKNARDARRANADAARARTFPAEWFPTLRRRGFRRRTPRLASRRRSERAARARGAATCHLWFSRRRADAAWVCPSCAESSPARCAACGTPYDMQSTDHPDRMLLVTIVRNGPCCTNSSSGNPRAWAPTRWDTGADTGRRIGDRRRVPKCRG